MNWYFLVLLDIEVKFFQHVRFWETSFTTLQIVNWKICNASKFESSSFATSQILKQSSFWRIRIGKKYASKKPDFISFYPVKTTKLAFYVLFKKRESNEKRFFPWKSDFELKHLQLVRVGGAFFLSCQILGIVMLMKTFSSFVNNNTLTTNIKLFKQSPTNQLRHIFNPSSKRTTSEQARRFKGTLKHCSCWSRNVPAFLFIQHKEVFGRSSCSHLQIVERFWWKKSIYP